jgi:hypothetical protein
MRRGYGGRVEGRYRAPVRLAPPGAPRRRAIVDSGADPVSARTPLRGVCWLRIGGVLPAYRIPLRGKHTPLASAPRLPLIGSRTDIRAVQDGNARANAPVGLRPRERRTHPYLAP